MCLFERHAERVPPEGPPSPLPPDLSFSPGGLFEVAGDTQQEGALPDPLLKVGLYVPIRGRKRGWGPFLQKRPQHAPVSSPSYRLC